MTLRTFSGTLSLALFLATVSPVLAQFERVDAITLQSDETGLLSAVIDPEGAFAYFGAQGSPAHIVKVDLNTFERVDAISLLAVEGSATSAVIDLDGAFAYFGTSSTPARVVKVDLETFQRVGSITLEAGEGGLRSVVIDPESAFAYFGTTTSTLSDDVGDRVVKVDLETFERDDAITLEDFEDELLTAVIDPNGAFAYFGTNTPTVSRGEVVKINLETFERVGSISTENDEGNPSSAVVSPDGTTAYFGAGTGTNPVRIIQVDLETFERAGTITLETITGSSTSAVISPSGAFAYFGTLTSPGRVIKVDLETFELVDTITLESGENNLRSAVAGSDGDFSYFGTWSNDPGRIIKIQLGEESAPGGGTRYVDGGTGSDTSDCADTGNPCATISYAIDQANPGDTVQIAAGAYTETLVITKSLTLNGEEQETTFIQGHEEPGQGSQRTITIGEDLEVEISGVTIRHGVSLDGGGLFNEGSALDLTNVTFFRNLTSGNGGGIYNLDASGTFRNVTFVENIAFDPSSNDNRGGGIYNDGSSPTLINVLVMECVASLEGGGMYNANSSPTLMNVTLSRNAAGIEAGGGMYNLNSTPTLTNSIVWGNMAAEPGEGVGDEIYNDGDSSVELFHSLYGNDEGDIEEGGGFTAENSLTDDPLFVDAEERNLRLDEGSPATDAGDPATDLELFPTDENGNPVDLDGNPRVFNDVAIDIGAYEFQEPQLQPVAVSGWRLLTVPGTGLSVGDLAGVNLVQGVEGSYPGAEPNLYVNYAGPAGDDYVSAGSLEEALEPGRGFFWYFFEEDDYGGATPPPEWVALEDIVFPVPFGETLEEDVNVAFEAVPATEGGDLPAYMIGNPFGAAFELTGISVDTGTLQTNFSAWDPEAGSYVSLSGADLVSPWQGVWAEVDSGDPPTFTFDFDSVDETANPPIVGVTTESSFVLDLTLQGTLEAGRPVNDLANRFRFEEDAMVGWDRHDGSKRMPPLDTPRYALLSPEGTYNGQLKRQSVRSLPGSLNEVVTVPVAFLATDPGSFEISAATENLPEDWEVTFRDLETGEETDLLESGYAFTAGATGDWQGRFSVTITPVGVVNTEDAPLAFRLSNPAPNPATESTALVLRVPEAQSVTARVYDALGRQVATIHDGSLAAGAEVRLEIDTADLAAGAYVVRVEGEGFAETRRFAVVR